jgi:hypothetical protein
MNLATAVDDNAVAGILLVLASLPSSTAGVPVVVRDNTATTPFFDISRSFMDPFHEFSPSQPGDTYGNKQLHY